MKLEAYLANKQRLNLLRTGTIQVEELKCSFPLKEEDIKRKSIEIERMEIHIASSV